MTEFDGIIVGGGHNGLTTAAYLAKAGLSVAVIERNEVMGGGCSTEEITLPGFKHSTHSNYHFLAEGPVPRDLQLENYGLSYIYPEVQHAMVFDDETAVTIHRNPEATAASFRRFNKRDADRYLELHEMFSVKMRALASQFMYSAPMSVPEIASRVGGKEGEQFLSYGPMTLHEAVDSDFEDEHIRTVFKTFLHAIAQENVPGSGIAFPRLFSRLTRLGLPVGGAVSVARALERFIEDHGGTLIRGAHVDQIMVSDRRATGVRLADGRTLTARRFIASGVDAPQTIRLAGEENFDSEIVEGLKAYKWAGHSLVTLHLALEERPKYKAAAFDSDVDRAFMLLFGVNSGQEIETMFDEIHQGKLPTKLAGNGAGASLFDPSIAPAGKHTAFWWPWAPYALDGDPENWDLRREEIGQELLRQWRHYAPNLEGDVVLGSAVFTPLDIERHDISMVNGSHHLGAYLPQQNGATRPVPQMSQYRTPVDGLYLCAASSHPGGAVSAGPGYNAAGAIAADLGLNRWWPQMAEPRWPSADQA